MPLNQPSAPTCESAGEAISITRVYFEANAARVFVGWSDEPMPAAILAMHAENERLRATIERVKALADGWALLPDRVSTHYAECVHVHPDCFVLAIRAALEPTQTKGKP